jgi:hypothetical protein
MTKLTDAQLIVLSKAAAREDGAGAVPPRMNKAAAAKVGASLAARKLMREIRAKPGLPVWCVDEQGRRIRPGAGVFRRHKKARARQRSLRPTAFRGRRSSTGRWSSQRSLLALCCQDRPGCAARGGRGWAGR